MIVVADAAVAVGLWLAGGVTLVCVGQVRCRIGLVAGSATAALAVLFGLGGLVVLQQPDRAGSQAERVLLAAVAFAVVVLLWSTTRRRSAAMSGEDRGSQFALRQSEARFAAIFEQAAVGVAEIEAATGRFLRANRRCCEIVDLTHAEITTTTFMAITHRDDLAADLRNRERLIAGEIREFSMEKRYLRRDGLAVWINLTVSPMWVEGEQPTTHIAVIEEISARRGAEEALRRREHELRQAQKLEAVGRLAGGVAHDFNNLLTMITGNAELLEARLVDQAVGEAEVREILSASDRAAELTRQLLAFGRQQMRLPVVLDPNQLIRGLMNMMRSIVGERIQLDYRLAEDVGCINADAGQIEQIVVNLAVNARDAMPGDGQLIVETRCVRPGDLDGLQLGAGEGYVVIEFRDSGVGMDSATQEHIFEPFYSTKEEGMGSGLGLATVYGIVKQSEGHIVVDSRAGLGSTFRILLPTVDAVPEHGVSADRRLAVRQAGRDDGDDGGGGESVVPVPATVLWVEDEESLRELVGEMLAGEGYRVLYACDGFDAVKVAKDFGGDIDILVTDVVMPRMTGPKLVAVLKPLRPEMKTLFVSGYSGEHLGREALPSDAAFVQKPFRSAVLLSAVRSALSRSAPAGP